MSEQQHDNQPGAVSVETPLHYFLGRSSGVTPAGLVVCEAPLMGHLVIRGNVENVNFCAAVEDALGLALPRHPCTFNTQGSTSLYWLGPGEWLATVTQGTQSDVIDAVTNSYPSDASVVDVSGGQTVVNLSGSAVPMLLQKSSGYDFHNQNFGQGRCVQTTFAKASALFSRCEDGSVDLIIRRSFADYIALWLLDAATEYGCRIE